MSLMYDKTFTLSTQARKFFDQGKMFNLVLINIIEILVFFGWFFMVMTAPATLIGATIYIIYELGAVGIIGPVMMFFVGLIVNKV
jgi:hypothetical protein